MFENLSIGHLALVLVIVLLLFGAKRIPEIAGSLGQGINQFKKSMNTIDHEPVAPPPVAPPPVAPPPVAARDAVPLSGARPSSSTAMSASDDVVREPRRLL